jgi:trehalose 6-phosphate phosphatase
MSQIPLPPPPEAALFLDVDGTLLELAPTPESVVVSRDTRSLLEDCARSLSGAVALISGRRLADLDRLFAPLCLPAAGVHGLERRQPGGTWVQPELPAGWREALLGPLQAFARRHPGLSLEDKGTALALHYRGAPAEQAAAEAMAEHLLQSSNLPTRLLRGKMVLEFMPVGSDKGQAIEAFMREPPYRDRTPVFIGDDVTDEAGFEAVNALGGCSLRVGGLAGSAARHSLDDVHAVHTCLRRWLD